MEMEMEMDSKWEMETVMYAATKRICWMILVILRRVRVWGKENIPGKGGLVITSNHSSYWDPVIISCVMERQIHFMANRGLFKILFLGSAFRALGAFPVDRRHPGTRPIKQAISLLKEGKVVGVFPEGGTNHTGRLVFPELGSFFLAARAQVPVLPVGIVGARGVVGRVRVYIGESMPPPAPGLDRLGLEDYGRRWTEAINCLLDRSAGDCGVRIDG
ncbi:MAG: lysophospholipid acyltransferase family protein [Peptococcaceae bacterium]|nr:lysophospholipid acyltransferase family protein [Peptococcaceae bacterium]